MFDFILRGPDGNTRTLAYNPHTSSCVWADTGETLDTSRFNFPKFTGKWKEAFAVSPTNPAGKSRSPKSLKIQLGLKCNYSCTYCNQRAQPQDSEGNPKQVARFLKKLPEWFDIGTGKGTTIEFWGGEPFVYWKTLKPLAEGVRALYPEAEFNIITNGSLFDQERVDWMYDLGFGVGISHDGPAYEAGRGEDPLLNAEQRRWIRYAYDRLFAEGRIGFNCVLTTKNVSLHAVRLYLSKHLGVPTNNIPLTTEEILLPYDEGGMSLSLFDDEHTKRLTHTTFFEAFRGFSMGVSAVESKSKEFLMSVEQQRPASSLGQKCGMDRPDNIAVDMNGNVMTCQNMSPLTKHNLGHLDAFDHIKTKTMYHWSVRDECAKCPVVQLCKGACLFLEDDYWKKGCDNSFAYNLGVLAASLAFATGMVLIEIRGENIRREGISSVSVIEPDFLDKPLPSWYFLDEAKVDARSAA
jgi:uncharacterized protein